MSGKRERETIEMCGHWERESVCVYKDTITTFKYLSLIRLI